MSAAATRPKTVYVSVTDTAKLVRAALKTAFPGIRFSVRSESYSGGASIWIKWIDGPTEKQVERVTAPYRGATFDGMIDLKESVYHAVNGAQVHYGADYINGVRGYSVAFAQAIADQVADKWGQPWPTIAANGYDGCARIDIRGEPVDPGNGFRGYTLGDLINQALGATDAREFRPVGDE